MGRAGRLAAVSEEAVERLVHCFYAKVRGDGELGPVFEAAIAPEQWSAHLATMCDFWSSLMLATGRYKSNPLAAHTRVEGITPELFERWLELFGETVDEIFEEGVGATFRAKAERIAQSFQIGLFYRPEMDRPKTA
ncbi:MAG: group III truncated hemoglobin [Mesorhizobium sp.]|nr:MAG: group III truncated hemoglobin [Mesorhizobium sp.]TIL94165.1 MAG: group III truncated hemoglobin [Mesorhizobium sp.]TIM03050.1 MAG: group III truncated hemoglobin [Mesorhizobium sp.]TIM67470.1 MAG: group III truncated hemoglobin [Mesorhizobium sp.]TIN21196.1 MAG: group III truncated hemoglobin [Mesorhizobium sp.]